MYLLIVTTVIGFLSAHTAYVSKKVLRLSNRATKEERELLQSRTALLAEQSELSSVKDFVRYSKLQRKINAVEQKLRELESGRNSGKFVFSIAMSYGFKILIAVTMLFLSVYYRKVPVFFVDMKYNLFPFGGIISFPNDYVNSVSVHFWLICCSRVGKLINIK